MNRPTSKDILWLLLPVITGLVLRIEVGRRTFIDFDEWQHIFMATGARWNDVAFELRTNAHPFLFFALLRGLLKLWPAAPYRFISVAAGTGSIAVVWLIGRRIFQSSITQLLCTTGFALSVAAIAVSTMIRSYQLAVFFVLIAFLAWLDVFSDAGRVDGRFNGRSLVVLSFCSSLALLSHYSALFFMAAAVAVPVLLAALSHHFRRRFTSITAKQVIAFVLAFALPFVVFAVEYWVHIRHQLMQGYAAEFYWRGTPNESAVAFALRNLRNFNNLFSPVEVQSSGALIVVVTALAVAAVVAILERRHRKPERTEMYAAALGFAIVISGELLVASLARKYPFGGLLRHQYIAGPFLLIAAFALVDYFLSTSSPIAQRVASVLLIGAMAANLAVQWRRLIVYPGEVILKSEFDTWKSAFPGARGVYVDHWGVIAYLIHTDRIPRHFIRRIPDLARIDQYHITDGTPGGSEIFYDKTRDNLNFSDPSIYESFAACLRGSGLKELTLFFISAGDKPFDRPPAEMERVIARMAAEHGLVATRIVASPNSAFAGFQLR
jgi:hypothetical protein